MDYEAIQKAAQVACVDAINVFSGATPATAEQQAAVFTAGISAALQEYARQKNKR